MGSGASTEALFDVATELNLNHEQRKRFKLYYSEMSKSGMAESKIREKLVLKFKAEKGTNLTESEEKSTGKLHQLPINKPKVKEPKSMRVSIQQESMISSPNDIIKSKAILEEANIENDEGDPFPCILCKTSFKTEALLDRHVKFSYIHAKMLQDIENAKEEEERAKKIAFMVHDSIKRVRQAIMQRQVSSQGSKARSRWLWAFDKIKSKLAIAKTTESLKMMYRSNLKHAKCDVSKLIYDGSKFFWRSQVSIDLHIYLHDDDETKMHIPDHSPVLEVIGYDVHKQKEYMRLYLSYFTTRDLFKDKINEALSLAMAKLSGEGDYTSSTPSVCYEFNLTTLTKQEQAIMVKTIADNIANKIDIMTHPHRPSQKYLTLPDSVDTPPSHLARQMSTSSTVTAASAVVDEQLVLKAIKPVEVIRRRRTSDEERTAALQDFSRYHKELSSLTSKAAVHMLNLSDKAFGPTASASVSNLARLDDLTEKMTMMSQLLQASASAPVLPTAASMTEASMHDKAVTAPVTTEALTSLNPKTILASDSKCTLEPIKEVPSEVLKPETLKQEKSVHKNTPTASVRKPANTTNSTRVAAGTQATSTKVTPRKGPTTPPWSVGTKVNTAVVGKEVTSTKDLSVRATSIKSISATGQTNAST